MTPIIIVQETTPANELLIQFITERKSLAVVLDDKDLCRVHVKPSGFPVEATVTVVKDGQHSKKTAFYVRLNNKTHEFTEEDEKQKYIAQRWGAT